MTEAAAEPNCIDIATPFVNELALYPDLPSVQIMGGIGSAALKHPRTAILMDERRIVTPPDYLTDKVTDEGKATQVSLNRFRPEGTLRDFDLLVLTTDEQAIEAVEDIARGTVDRLLEVSAFGLHATRQLDEQRDNPFGYLALRTFLSDRYVYEDGHMTRALFPFEVPLESEVMEAWTLEVGDQEFHVANPATMILNYLTRSISGLRYKDREKVQEMAGNIFEKAPELAEWMAYGPGKSQMEFASILHTLRRANSIPFSKRKLDLGGGLRIRAGSVRALADHEAFMLPDADADMRDALFSILIAKSRLLGTAESQQWVVTAYQKYAERWLDGITKNSEHGALGSTHQRAVRSNGQGAGPEGLILPEGV